MDIDAYRNQKILEKVAEHFANLDIHNSTALEGNSLTLAEVSVFIENGITVHGKSFKDHMEVHNYSKCLKWLKENIHNDNLELSILLIKLIHRMVTNETLEIDGEDFSGKFRNDFVGLSTTTYIPPDYRDIESLLEKEVSAYYKRLESGYSVFESACIFHREFERIHPFFDGNGRTGRVLLNLLIIQKGYPYLTIEVKDRVDYFEAIENNTFYEFACSILARDYSRYLRSKYT